MTAPTLIRTSPPASGVSLTPIDTTILKLVRGGTLPAVGTLLRNGSSFAMIDTRPLRWHQGSVVVPPAYAFNPTPVYGAATFTNSNDTEISTSVPTCIIGNTAIVGKKAFSMRLDAFPGNYGVVGVSIATGTPGSGIGFDGNNSVGYYSNNSIFGPTNSSPDAGGGVPNFPAVGGFVSILVDQTNAKIWMTVNGVNFNNIGTTSDVAAGLQGWGIAAPVAAGAIYPCVGSYASTGHQWTYMAYQHTLPSGFTSM